MKIIFELLRIIVIFVFFGGLGWAVIGYIYSSLEVKEMYSWIGAIAVFVLVFVLYRNKWQFTGWYKGKGREKLPKNLYWILIAVSIVLMSMPIILSL